MYWRVSAATVRIVAMASANVSQEGTLGLVSQALFRAVGGRAVVRVQLSLGAGHHALPEPDVAVVPGTARYYERRSPTTALLVVEVSDASVREDRLTKAALYAAARIPDFWLVNLPDDCVEVRRRPEPGERRYASVGIARRGQAIEIAALPGVRVAVDDLLPSPWPEPEGP